jgi:carbonic anhydrase
MCNACEYPELAGRRRFLRLSGAATLAGLTGGSALFAGLAHADALTKAQRDSMTPQQIIEEMKRGNARFQRGERKPRNYLREQRASSAGQYPAAVLLSCIDSASAIFSTAAWRATSRTATYSAAWNSRANWRARRPLS